MTSSRNDESAALSTAISRALRHEPWIYELEPDGNGWVDLEMLVAGLRKDGWASLTSSDVRALVESADKQRHQITDRRIRALYGHSLDTRISHPAEGPPTELFHGTSPAAVSVIRTEGLLPMGRQCVHLSVDVPTAVQVGKRKAHDPVVLCVAAADAHDAGIQFYKGNKRTWLADSVPAQYITEVSGQTTLEN